eukprot:scaffold73_cov337-Pavlova_lutheri.AAC.40
MSLASSSVVHVTRFLDPSKDPRGRFPDAMSPWPFLRPRASRPTLRPSSAAVLSPVLAVLDAPASPAPPSAASSSFACARVCETSSTCSTFVVVFLELPSDVVHEEDESTGSRQDPRETERDNHRGGRTRDESASAGVVDWIAGGGRRTQGVGRVGSGRRSVARIRTRTVEERLEISRCDQGRDERPPRYMDKVPQRGARTKAGACPETVASAAYVTLSGPNPGATRFRGGPARHSSQRTSANVAGGARTTTANCG